MLAHGWSDAKQSFTQSYDSDDLDASSLLMASVGFIDAADPRFASTVEAIRREQPAADWQRWSMFTLGADRPERQRPPARLVLLPTVPKVQEGEAIEDVAFIRDEMANMVWGIERRDVGLLSEEYDPVERRQLGNFPQAFTHLALVNTALVLGQSRGIRDAEA